MAKNKKRFIVKIDRVLWLEIGQGICLWTGQGLWLRIGYDDSQV